MRTGHGLYGSHLYRLKIIEQPWCECGEEETINHIFLDCPINKTNNWNLKQELEKTGFADTSSMKKILKNINYDQVKLIIQFLNINKRNI